MPAQIHYVESVTGRRPQVLAELASARIRVQTLDDPAAVPAEATIVLVGVDDLPAALPGIRRLADGAADRQVLVLWESQDPSLLIEAVRAGARDVIVSASAVGECAARALERQSAQPTARRPRGRVVVVYSLKGGIGKSTVSANLAIALHRASGLPTTAVDLSLPCGNLDMYLDVQPARSIGELLAAGADIEPAMVRQALADHPSGLRVLAGPRAASAEALTRHSCQPVLSALGEGGGLVVVDLGAFIEYAHASVLESADLVVVPIMPIISSLGTLSQARDVLAGFGVGEDRILPILNHAGPESATLAPDAVARLMGGTPAHALPWGGADVLASLNEGLPLVLHRPQSPLALAIDGLARDCLARLGVAPAEARPAPKPAMFDWLRGLFLPRGVAHVHP